MPKRPVGEARLGPLGFEGDAVRHTRVHGGPERAVCIWSLERIEALRAEGHPIEPGGAGENLTLEGIDFGALQSGDRIALGAEAVIELTKPTTPCNTIAHCFADGDSMRIHQDRHPGWSRWYARVLTEGVVREADWAGRV